jgi:endonuclease YncB( thermonuclease family)
MTDRSKQSVRAWLILMALCLPVIAQTQTITGKVVAVSDGDTITVLDADARTHQRGLWTDPEALPQREFRKSRKQP